MVAVLPSGTKLTPARLTLVARKTADETVNNSATLQNDDTLALSAVAIADYLFECSLRYSTNGTANLKWSFTVPAGAAIVYSALHIPAGGSALTMTELINTGVGTADDSINYVRMLGIFQTVGTAGTLQLQWAQNTANASDTKVLSASFMTLQRIS